MKKNWGLIIVMMLLLGFIGCQNLTAPKISDDPAKVFEQFVKALDKNDFQSAWELLSTDSQKQFQKGGQPSVDAFKEDISKILNDKVERSRIVTAKPVGVTIRASVKIEFQQGDKTQTEEVQMVKEDGKWKVTP